MKQQYDKLVWYTNTQQITETLEKQLPTYNTAITARLLMNTCGILVWGNEALLTHFLLFVET